MLQEILGRLDKVKKAGKNYVACCPVHQDNNPSMSISEQGTRGIKSTAMLAGPRVAK